MSELSVKAAIAKLGCCRHRRFFGNGSHLAIERRQGTSRVGVVRLAGQSHRLAAAAAPVDFLALAGLAGLRHPLGAAIGIEGLGVQPDFFQRLVLHVVKDQSWNGLGRMAGQNLARGRNIDHPASPSAHAGLGKARIIVGHDRIDHDDAVIAPAQVFEQFDGIQRLLIGGHQRIPVGQGPAVILGVRDFDPPGAELHGEFHEFLGAADILPVDHRIDRQRQSEGHHLCRQL